ncbi:MAG: hypothetical protein H7338_24810 [Candidatus Sericytochromatia bacterium]|nr:hypothetical protein [Candidatus Sericytochromatia bacterium]
MRIITAALILSSLLGFGCTSATPTGASGSGKTSGTMVVPRETDPAVAMAPMSFLQLARGYMVGLPALAGTLDASVVAQFQASVDGRAAACTWDRIETTSGETRARFTFTNPSSANNAEVIFRSPSGSIKLATLVDRMDANANADLATEVSARSTGALLVVRAMAASNGGKPIKSYTTAEFQAVHNSPRTVEVETSLRAAFSASGNKGQDTWKLPPVVAVTTSVASDLGVSLKLGANITL